MVKILLVIDLQKQFRDNEGCYEKCLQYIRKNQNSYCIIGTLFRNSRGSMYTKHLCWDGCINAGVQDVEYPFHKIIVKDGYSVDYEELMAAAREAAGPDEKDPQMSFDIIGCDADACVMATAFTLWDKKADFRILSEHIYTTSEEFTKEDVLKIMRRNFGDCTI